MTALSLQNVAVAREAAEKSFVLLKNEPAASSAAPVLPIRKGIRTVALIGPLADSRPDMLGTWSAQGKPEDVITLRTALELRAKTRWVPPAIR